MNTLTLAGPMPMLLAGIEQVLKTKYPELTIFICSDINLLEDYSQQYTSEFLLLDLSLQKASFKEKIKRILSRFPEMKVVILSTDERVKVIKSWFKLGVLGYASPTIGAEEITEGIDKIDRGKPYLQAKMNSNIIDELFCVQPKKSCIKRLTPRELQVISLIVSELTTKEIAARLFISPCTAETHRLNIIHKLGVKNTAGIVREAVLNELYI